MQKFDWNCCGSVILYNPTKKQLKELSKYLPWFNELFIYDNSLSSHKQQLAETLCEQSFTYLHDPDNAGIAKAYNHLVKLASAKGYSHMLLLDQDSVMSQTSLVSLLHYSQKNPSVALLAPKVIFVKNHTLIKEQVQNEKAVSAGIHEISFAITSGSLIRLAIFQEVGGYDENLFIDGVDREYCLKLLQANYNMLEVTNAYLYQILGNGAKNLFGVYEHSPLRNYYIFRNRLYLMQKYPIQFCGISRFYHLQLSSLKQLGSILLFERDKHQKWRYIILAWQDYRTATFGKIRDADYTILSKE